LGGNEKRKEKMRGASFQSSFFVFVSTKMHKLLRLSFFFFFLKKEEIKIRIRSPEVLRTEEKEVFKRFQN
jgi:hypothetical protein